MHPFKHIISSSTDLHADIEKVLKAENPLSEEYVQKIINDSNFALQEYETSQKRMYEGLQKSNIELVLDVTKVLFKWAKLGFETVSESEYSQRLNICNQCPYLVDTTTSFLYKIKLKYNEDMKVCSSCGCIVSRKAVMPKEECPLKKW